MPFRQRFLPRAERGAKTPAHAVPLDGAAHFLSRDGDDAGPAVRVRQGFGEHRAGDAACAFREQVAYAIPAAQTGFPGKALPPLVFVDPVRGQRRFPACEKVL